MEIEKIGHRKRDKWREGDIKIKYALTQSKRKKGEREKVYRHTEKKKGRERKAELEKERETDRQTDRGVGER